MRGTDKLTLDQVTIDGRPEGMEEIDFGEIESIRVVRAAEPKARVSELPRRSARSMLSGSNRDRADQGHLARWVDFEFGGRF